MSRGTAWRKFNDIRQWSTWNHSIESATWLQGDPWTEGAILLIRHGTLLGSTVNDKATIRMVVPESAAVWEVSRPGLQVVYSTNFRDDLGGCRLEARHTYHGLGALALLMIRSRQARNLTSAMAALKRYIEGV